MLTQILKKFMKLASSLQAPRPYDGESKELKATSQLAGNILGRLKNLESNHPYLQADYPAYDDLRNHIVEAMVTPPEDQKDLGVLYDKMRELLHHISDERNSEVATIGQARRLIPRNYLPISFDLLLEEFMAMESNSTLAQLTNDAMEDVIFGDLGIEEISFTHRDRIAAKVIKALVYDYGHADQIKAELGKYGERKVFRLLKLKNQQLEGARSKMGVEPLPSKNPETSEPIVASIALLILRTRAQISHERIINVPPKQKTSDTVLEGSSDEEVSAIA